MGGRAVSYLCCEAHIGVGTMGALGAGASLCFLKLPYAYIFT